MNTNKDNLLKAVDEYPILAKNAKVILKAIIMFDDPIPAESIVRATGLVKQIVYPALSKLLSLKFIIKNKSIERSYYLYSINEANLFKVLDLHSKTQLIRSKIDL